MKKIILISILFMSLIGCDSKNTKIELPDGLTWGMTIVDVDKLGLTNFHENEKVSFQNYTMYYYKSISYKDFHFSSLGFDSNNELLTINFNDNYYNSIDSKNNRSDYRGDKAIALYKFYILKFDSLYKVKESKGVIPVPADDFWQTQTSCDESQCMIANKKYIDKDGTELTVQLSSIKDKNEIIGIVGISFKRLK